MTDELENILEWSGAREVQTKYGPRLLRKAEPTQEFWALWAQDKYRLKEAGISISKDLRTNEFQVCWWQTLNENIIEERAANLEASTAADSTFQPPAPPGCIYMPFQRAGIHFAHTKQGVYFADEMGLGKTIEAIGTLNVHMAANPEFKRILVITKASLKENWHRELDKWLIRKLNIDTATGQYFPKRADCVIMNYDILTKHYHALRAAPWDAVILDEAANIKNRKAKRTLNVVGFTPSKKQLEKGEQPIPPIVGKVRMALSGTPIENRPEEIWTTLFYLDPVRWGSFWSFARKYCAMTSENGMVDTSGASNLDQLQRVLRETIMIRRLKKEVLTELPPKTRVIVEMDTEGFEDVIERDQSVYRQHERTLEDAQVKLELARASGSDEEFKRAVKEMAGAQFAFSEIAKVRHDTAVAKVPALIPLLEEDLEESGKMLVFGHHRDVLHPLHAAFPGSVIITGDTPAESRQSICDIFQESPHCKVFFGSIRACGEGLTLTAAKLVCFVEQDWAPGKMSQAEDRAHRIGQRDNVLVKHYVLPGTIDAKMIKTNIGKQEIIEQALDSDPGEWANEPAFAPAKPLGKRKQIVEEGLLMTFDQIAAVHAGLQKIAGVCDGARTWDGHGFNKIDARIGKELAYLNALTPGQAALGRRLCRRYRKQIGDQLLLGMGVALSTKPETEHNPEADPL